MAESKTQKYAFNQSLEIAELRLSIEALTDTVQTLTSVLAPELERTATLQRMEAESLSARMAINEAVGKIYNK